MIRINLTDKTIKEVKKYLSNNSIANRGKGDGSVRNQAVGLACELEVHNYLLGYYPILQNNGFDGGFDLILNGLKIDIKAMERKSYVKHNYVNNFFMLQENYNVDVLVFCSFHSVDRIIELCGWIYKKELKVLSKFYKAGTVRTRFNGTSFKLREDNYEIEMRNLKQIDLLLK